MVDQARIRDRFMRHVRALAAFGFLVLLAGGPAALAQVTIDGGSSGALPAFAGTGLSGVYYNYGITSDPLATFTTTNVCYPTCFAVNPYVAGGGSSDAVFMDDTGGLLAFTNGHIDNVVFNPNFTAPDDWSESNLTINGYLAITQPGTYLFSLGADDYGSLEIAGQTILNVPYPPCCETLTQDVTFSAAGLYAIALQFGEYETGSFLSLIATTDDQNLPSACLIGCVDGNGNLTPNGLFYSDTQLEGAPAPMIGGGWPSIAALAMAGVSAAVSRHRRNIAS